MVINAGIQVTEILIKLE